MAKKLVSRTAKVLSETKKNKDNEAVAIAYEHVPRNPEELKHGSIYAVIELEDKSGHAEEIAEKIIDVLHDTFYKNTDQEPLESFEASLAKINEELTERSSEGQINWLGKLNAVLAIFSDNTLHVSQTGKAEAYLYRKEHTMHITEDLAGDSINPQRTFKNIASGNLSEKDKVCFVTPGIFYKISKSELKEYTTASSPKIASENISKLLSGENGTVKPNAVLLMEVISPESFAADDEAVDSNETWVKEEKNKIEEITSGVTGQTIKVVELLGSASSAISQAAKTRAIPFIKDNYSEAINKISELRKPHEKENIIIESEENLTQMSERSQKSPLENKDLDLDLDDETQENEATEVREIRIKETKKNIKILPLERFDFSFKERFKNFKTNTFANKKNLSIPKGKKSYLAIGMAALLVCGLIFYFGFVQNIIESERTAEAKINQARALYESSLTEISASNFRLASSNLKSAESLALEVSRSNHFTKEAEELLSTIHGKKDEANQITRNASRLLYEFKDVQVSQVFTNGTLLYALDNESGSVYSIDPRSGAMATIVRDPEIGAKVRAATLVAQRSVLVIYTDQGEIFEINLNNGRVQAQPITRSPEGVTMIAHFGTSVYLLSPDSGQISRHFRIARGYGPGADYFTESQDLNKTVGMAIDGSIYLTDAFGQIRRFTRGVMDTFSINETPIDYTTIRGIYTGPDHDIIYLFTENLVIKLDKNGRFTSQHANDAARNITGITVIRENVYFLSDNKVYLIEN